MCAAVAAVRVRCSMSVGIAAFWCVAASRRYVSQSDGAVATEGCLCADVVSVWQMHSTHTGANLWQRSKLMAKYGPDGARGGLTSWTDHMRTPAGEAELRAFAERVQARFQAEVSAQPAHLLRGAPRIVGFSDTPSYVREIVSLPALAAAASCACSRGAQNNTIMCAPTWCAASCSQQVQPVLTAIQTYTCQLLRTSVAKEAVGARRWS